ncbi:MAG: twin-arginine translocase subunit TatC [Verrucomicrobiales bacterium]|nr:twin-arginine translocase subunit TatC [Verrucomicrobiales bacterium]
MILKSVFEKLFKIREEAAKVRPGADEGYDPHEKPFLDHLEDLRTTLMQMGATLAISTFLCFAFHVQIFKFLQLPSMLTKMEDGSTLWDKINFIFLAPQEGLMLMIKVSFFTAVVISMPLLIFFMFQFILPGLRQVEKKMIIPGAGVGFILFLTGASFAFFLAAPIALKFFFVFENQRFGDLNPAAKALEKPISELPLLGVGGTKIEPFGTKKTDEETPPPATGEEITQTDKLPESPDTLSDTQKAAIRGYMIDLLAVQQGKDLVLRYDEARDKIILAHFKGAKSTYQVGKYFEFITRLTLVFGLSFQLPVVVTILVKLELLTARVMRATRTYAWIIIMVAAAILTPPDIMTLGLLAGPMIILYEICVIIASVIERRREKRELAEEEKRRSRLERLYSKPPEDLSESEKAELHKHEIEQYEKEHAHLYDEHGHEIDADGNLIGYDPDHDDHNHDESWNDDHHYWHDGEEESDEPVDEQDVDDHHKEDGEFKPVQDWPDKETEPEAESDHAEPTGEEAEPEMEPQEDEDTSETEQEEISPNDECCEPSGPVVDMNHATVEELMDLPGVDDWLANMIIDHRPYESFEDLEEIVGDEKVMEWMERLMLG